MYHHFLNNRKVDMLLHT